MNITEMIAEWRKGCSCATPDAPEKCPTCTKALIVAIENRLKADHPEALEACRDNWRSDAHPEVYENPSAAFEAGWDAALRII